MRLRHIGLVSAAVFAAVIRLGHEHGGNVGAGTEPSGQR